MIHFFDSLREARRRTLALVADLSDAEMIGPRLEIVNPLLWEIGHVAWFQEYWVLRHLNKRAPVLPDGDALYDSAKVAHETRWDIPLLSRTKVLAYMQEVLDQVIELCNTTETGGDAAYFLSLVLFHEDMHDEAFGYTRQTLGYPQPQFEGGNNDSHERAAFGDLGDALIPGGRILLGSLPDRPFVFDNEMDAHEVELKPFSISRTAVSNAEFAAFVAEGGYEQREFWSDAGWQWRQGADARQPVYWQRDGNKWLRRNFDQWVPLEDHLPVLHVNWHEANAFCRWARRRLPTESEWEMAASTEPNAKGQGFSQLKRTFPWGNEPPNPNRANLDWQVGGSIDVRALPAGDSAFGCRQMIGNAWEWTASDFTPYPGFVAGPYKEYSAPWFGDHKVLRGGCWTTRSRMIHNAYRNFYQPHRRDVWAGFRTCAL
jgi:gamma-glutamyl hercynylcysteine S-oxide synthase